jgi:hypothetical protein
MCTIPLFQRQNSPKFGNKFPEKLAVPEVWGGCSPTSPPGSYAYVNEIPTAVLNLSAQCIRALRPFDIDCGAYKRQTHGYRVKTGMLQLHVSQKSVLNKIRDLPDSEDRRKCRVACEYLMNSHDSSYSHFIELRQQIVEGEAMFNTFDFSTTIGIECALWPNIYPFTNWCESTICGKEARLSSKRAFSTKVFSEVTDYVLHYELLQWQYDRALYKVVSGAINSARVSNCSPARALDTKPFSPTYWQWQHRYLLDAVEQFGLPDAFITISPYEWSFPFAKWVSCAMQSTGMGPTQLAGYQTFNIAHTLEQVVRGYICGSTSQKWTQHLFSYNRIATQKNVKTFFYRFEFQERGTLHLHMLVWLKDITKAQHQVLRADIPHSHPELAFLVHKLQPSDKKSHCLNLQYEDSFFRFENGKHVQHLKYPAQEFALNLCAYIATLIPALKCRMDYQTTDGVAMLLRYVTSYVTKSHDCITIDSMYSYKLEGRQAAMRYLMRNMPAEPEMWFFLFSKKVAWSSSRTKRFTVPTSENALNDKTVQKYWKRSNDCEKLTMIEWLRLFDTNKANPKAYKQGSTIVGTKTVSLLNKEYFFQYVLLNLPHRSVNSLHHANHEQLPKQLQWFAAALHHFPELWTSDDKLKSWLITHGHRDSYIRCILSYIASLRDLFYLVRIQVITNEQLETVQQFARNSLALDSYQLAVANDIDKAVHLRHQFYTNDTSLKYHQYMSDSDDECGSESDDSLDS